MLCEWNLTVTKRQQANQEPETPDADKPRFQAPVPRPMFQGRNGRPDLLTLTHNPEDGTCTGYVLTEQGYEHIARLASEGVALAVIAASLCIGEKTFRELRQRDERCQGMIDLGRQTFATEITDTLRTHMREGNVTAAIFLAKTMGGMKEQVGELPDATPKTIHHHTVNIQINAPMSDEEFARLTDPATRMLEAAATAPVPLVPAKSEGRK